VTAPPPSAAELLAGRDVVVLRCAGCGRELTLRITGPGAATVRRPLQAALLAIAVGLEWSGCESTAPADAEQLCAGCR
jgi:hypothetical protein